jgi:hypothetical protein
VKAGHRSTAACAAAMAGCGKGRDDPPLGDRERARWRTQALAWLEAELAGFRKLLASDRPEARNLVRQKLAHWREYGDLAGLRDLAALAGLPADERKSWRAFWSEVDVLSARAAGRRER